MAEIPVIYGEKCNGCGLCISVCLCGALILVNNIATVISTEVCDWCFQCEVVCPSGAIVCPLEIVLEEL